MPTTVLELAPRILARVCDEEIGGLVEAAHRRHGVDLRLGCAVASVAAGRRRDRGVDDHRANALHGGPDRRRHGRKAERSARRRCGARRSTTGSSSTTYCRTSDPAIFAAGDVVRFPGPHGPVRLENWRHAQDQGDRRRPQCRRRERAVPDHSVVLVRTVRPLHPGRRLAGGGYRRESAGRCRETPPSSSTSATDVSWVRWASTCSGIWRPCGV